MLTQVQIKKTLHESLADLQAKNPAYSLRRFARKLGISPAAVSEILSGKRRISPTLALKIAARLGLDPEQSAALVNDAALGKTTRAQMPQSAIYTNLDMDQFHLIGEWQHFAILAAETKDFNSQPEWIAKRLGIRKAHAQSALARLERLGLLKGNAMNGYRATGVAYVTSDEIFNVSLRRSHACDLELAKTSLESDELSARDFSAVTLAFDRNRMPAAKRLLRQFRDQFCLEMEKGPKNDVYKLCLQFIPLTKIKENQT